MKISTISKKKNIFTITWKPNAIERFFNIKSRTENFKDTGHTYKYFDGSVYINQKGKIMGPVNIITKTLDNWRRKF